VVDDADMGITEVIRGDDLIPSTPRQLLLYEALELRAAAIRSRAPLVGPDGRRLAKRHGDTRLSALRTQAFGRIAVGVTCVVCGGYLDGAR